MNGVHVFTLGGIPVFVSAWYFLLMFFFMRGGIQSGLLWAGSVTVSVLVHEFGHALVARRLRLQPKIMLHGWGGLCAHERAESDKHDALIIAAGPGAGLVLGLVFVGVQFGVAAFAPEVLLEKPLVGQLFWNMIFINVFWSFVNLIPLWPLDGGQLYRLGLMRVLPPAKAERITHITGVITGVVGLGLAYQFMHGLGFVTIIAALLIWQNVQRINDSRASGPIRLRNKFSHELLKRAEEAYRVEDWTEAARLCHQIRAEPNLDSNTLGKVWVILAVSTTEMESYEEAMSYIHRAELKGPVFESKIKCVLALKKRDEVAGLLAAPEAKRLRADIKRELEALANN